MTTRPLLLNVEIDNCTAPIGGKVTKRNQTYKDAEKKTYIVKANNKKANAGRIYLPKSMIGMRIKIKTIK